MPKELDIFLSNSLDVLYENLKTSLFTSHGQPFAKRLVIVYGPAMKSWITLKMAQDPDLGIAAGVEFLYLNEAFDRLMNLFQKQTNQYLPSRLELALFIEKEIISVLSAYFNLSETDKQRWLPLIHYLKIDLSNQSLTLSSKMEKRLIGLSQHLAKLFQDYGRFAAHLTTRWSEDEPAGWQQQLWKAAFNEHSQWTYLNQALALPIQADPHYQIHFFSISYFAKCEFEFLIKLSHEIPCYSYLISPCTVFWSDIRSDKESGYLQLFWEKKLGQFSPQLDQLEELLCDRNPLLANFGRMGREMACQIEESQSETHAYYLLPSHVQNIANEQLERDDLHFYLTEEPLTLLHAIQADMLLMRNPNESPPFPLTEETYSIQLHRAANRRREIEILYHNLLGLVQKHPTLEPRDIIVMAPQISEYVPLIQSQFGSQESLIDCQILDLGLHTQSEIIQGFLQLIELSEGRWDASQLLQLFEQASFQRKHQISQEDFVLIRKWVEKAGIRWGDDALHRNDLLKKRHCRKGMLDETSVGTWNYGLSRLLLGLTHILQPNENNPLDLNPCEAIDYAEAELLGRWMRLLDALRDDLLPLQDGSQMSAEDWSGYFTCLLDTYFQPDFDRAESIEEYAELKAQFEILRTSARTFKEALFSYQSMKTHLHELLQQRGVTYRENYLQSVRFCSLIPLRSIPAKVIVLLGMQEGAFPRSNHCSSLNLADREQEVDYRPSPVDYDRYLFLEALHSAKDFLLISYQGYDQKDSQELPPSLLVDEFFSYLDRHYTINGRKVSDCCFYKHPFDSFDKHYFLSETRLCNFSISDFNAAQACFSVEKRAPHRLIEEFKVLSHPLKNVLPNHSLIELKQLCDVARNPIKFHLNRILEIYLQKSEERSIKIEEEFTLSDLDRSILKRQALKEPIKDLLKHVEREGKLPFGFFKEVAAHRLTAEVETLQQRLSKEELSQDVFLEIEFCASCKEPLELSKNVWLCPAITLNYPEEYQLYIVGKLSHATPKGLFAIAKAGSCGEIWKIWPQFLAYQYAVKMLPMKLERNLILSGLQKSKSPFFDDPEPHLKQFIEYYALCHHHFSPLLPEWMTPIFQNDVEGLQKEMNKIFDDSFGGYQNYDLYWVMNKHHLLDAKEVIEQWKKPVEMLLGDLMRHW